MSTLTKSKKKTERAEIGQAMKGCDILVEALEREGVEYIFAYPGGASMERNCKLTFFLVNRFSGPALPALYPPSA